jgi:glutamate/tyrosine decarboxylase-like PLP-dependent enzyme
MVRVGRIALTTSASGGRHVDDRLLARTAQLAADFLGSLDQRPVRVTAGIDELRSALGGPMPDGPEDSMAIVERLARDAEPGIVGSAGPRYFGFVVGGTLPAALAADWLTSTWDQNAGLYVLSPAAAVVEEVVEAWLVELFGLPAGTSAGFTTGATMASFTALAAARHRLLADVGWDVETQGLFGAPEVPVVVSDESHVTIFVSLQMLGLGRERVHRVATDEQGRMRADSLREVLAGLDRPAIVCAQSGNVNTGAFDPLPEIADTVRDAGGWLHVDGAFGLWAAASPTRRALLDGLERADSWTTDSHKWLNVPYDSGIVLVRDRDAHRAAMTLGAAYYVETAGAERDPYNYVAESSRRARGFAVYAALRSLGRSGLADLVDRSSDIARRIAERLAAEPDVAILNDVVLNQVLVRFADDDATTRKVIERVQADGTAWLGGTTWHGLAAMRISVSGWRTTMDDADRTADTIILCAREVAAPV